MHRRWLSLSLFLFVSCSSSHSAAPGAATPSGSYFGDSKGLGEAVQLVQAKRYSEAVAPLRSLLGSNAALEDYYLYYLGVAEARSGDDHALRRFAKLRTEQPQSIWAPAAALELGRLYRQQGKMQEAEAFLVVAETAPDKETAANARLERAQVLMAAGRDAEAAQILIDLRQEARGTSAVPQARALLRNLRAQDPDLALQGTQQWLDEGRLLLEERDYVGAEKAARTADPVGDDPEAHLLLAEALKGQGNTAAAVSVLGQVVERHPDDPLAAKALLRMAQLLWNQDEDIAAEAAFLQFLKRYPDSPSVPDALYAVARIQQSTHRSEAAIATYEKLAYRYPEAKTAWEARWRVGWIQYAQHHWADAATAFGQVARSSTEPSEAASAHYWQARALERSGRADEANDVYRQILEEAPISYYAGLAEERLGEVTGNAGGITAPGLPLPAAPATVNPYHLQRYLALRQLGLPNLARREVAAMERESSDDASRQFLFYAYANADDYPAARRIGREVEIPAGARERVLYPLAFWGEVSASASRNQVDPILVVSLIRQESLFDPTARSPADARGLMQLLPGTAHKEAAELGWKEDPASRLEDPAVNVALGVHHLRGLMDQYDGDVVKALAAYNGGTVAVNKWQRQFAELEGDEFVESISYRETRDYVKRVLGNRRAYTRLYASGG